MSNSEDRLRAEAAQLRARLEVLEGRAEITAARLLTAEDRVQLAMESAGLAWWDHDFVSGTVTRSGRWAEMLGYEPDTIDDRVETWKSMVHPDDVPKVERQARLHEAGKAPVFEVEHRLRAANGGWCWILNWGGIVERDAEGRPLRACGTHLDITRRKEAELDRERLILSLERALEVVKVLRGIIPICMGCKRIRDDQGYWQQLEAYLQEHSDAQFSHGLCSECRRRLYPELEDDRNGS